MSTSCIEFSRWENDKSIGVQLEPEPITFIVSPGTNLRFVGTNAANDFKWALRIDLTDKGIQLFPESLGNYKIEIFENDKLLEDWYKYM